MNMNLTTGRIASNSNRSNSLTSTVIGALLNATTTTAHPPPITQKPPILFWCFLAVETLSIIFGNGMLCWLFLSSRNLRTQQNYFVLSLSISDFLVGLTIAPCEYCALHADSKMCSLFCGTVLSFSMLASIINLVLIAADRYFSIMRPFQYQEILSKRRVKCVILVGWLTTLLLTLLPLAWVVNDSLQAEDKAKINFRYVITLFALMIVIGILLGISYYQIVRTIQSKLKEVKEKSSNPAGIKVCILVAISFFVCWIPTCITEMLISSGSAMPVYPVMNAVYFVFLMNPCLDPIMYAYYRRDFRHELSEWRQRRWEGIKKLYDRLFVKTITKRERGKQQRRSINSTNSRWNNNVEFKPVLRNDNMNSEIALNKTATVDDNVIVLKNLDYNCREKTLTDKCTETRGGENTGLLDRHHQDR